jgi:hypothetical protein
VKTPMKTVTPSGEMLQFRRELEDCMREHVKTLGAMEVLAVLAHLVGQAIALQDPRTVTPAMAMDLVSANLQRGNQEVIDSLLSELGGSA